MWEIGHQRAVCLALDALHRAGLQPLVMKGTALAYSLYPVASARARSDTDIFVQDDRSFTARAALEAAGFTWVPTTGGSQATFVSEVGGVRHAIDVHWQFNNSRLLANLFPHADLRARATALASLGPGANSVSPIDALLIACTHRLTHEHNPYYSDGTPHFSADRLIWLFDIHLLAGALAAPEWRELERLATDRGLRAVCADGLSAARNRFGTDAASGTFMDLDGARANEAPALYFAAGPIRQWFMDWSACDGPVQKARYVRELVFPSREYMRSRFGARPQWSLPFWYVRRLLAGAVRRVARLTKS
jgi:hypothetical protein